MKLRGPSDLRALRSRIASLPQVQTAIARRVAAELSKLSHDDFEARTTPSGEPWKPGKGGRALTLKKSGRLEQKATRFTATGTRVRASVADVPWARFQIKRGFLPRALPAAWAKRVREIASEEISKHLGGGR